MKTSVTSQSSDTISIMKGIAIVSVVAGHAYANSIFEFSVNQYHLAVFFFVAGMCFKDKYIADLKMYAWRRFKSLYVPFMQFGLFYLILHNLFAYMGVEYNYYDIPAALHEIRNFTIGLTSEDPLMGAMWFCPALMIVSVLCACILKTINMPFLGGAIFKIVGLCIIPILGELLCDLGVKSPRCLWEYMQICGVFLIGYYFSKFKVGRKLIGRNKIVTIILTTSIVLLMLALGYRGNLQPLELAKNGVVPTTLIAVSGSISIYCISSILHKIKFLNYVLSYIGDHSFSIMALHFLAFKIVSEIYILFVSSNAHLYEFPTIETNNIWWISFYIFIGVAFPLFLSRLYIRTIESIREII